ncbi:MAG TPA: ATP-binding protein [Ramlibacter sp.]|nr:ATP-binding protein [Ramlibacter sp.]
MRSLFSRSTPSAPPAPPPGAAPVAGPTSAATPAGGWSQGALDALDNGVAVFDRDKRLVAHNARFRSLMAFPAEPLPADFNFAALVDWTRRNGGAAASVAPGLLGMDGALPAQPRTLPRSTPDGSVVDLRVRPTPDGGLLLNFTEPAKAAADAPQQARNHFVANMSHELRTPMNAIIGMLQLLEASQLTPSQSANVAKAQAASRTLLNVMSDILDMARLESGQIELAPRRFEFEELLRDLAGLCAADLGDKDVRFHFDIDERVPACVVADDLRLRQVLSNLGSNAIKFTEAGQVTLRLSLEGRTADTATIGFAVEDTGIGMDAATLALVSSDIGQAEAAPTRRFGGVGIGLSICRRLVALMGGELRAASQPGRGSRFWFTLTVPTTADEALAGAVSQGASLAPRHVLLVSAGSPALVTMARALGWRLTQAAAADAIHGALGEALLQHADVPDAVLLDARLPGAAAVLAQAVGGRLPVGGPVPCVVVGHLEGGDEALAARSVSLHEPFTRRMLSDAVEHAQAALSQEAAPARVELIAEARMAGKPLAGLRLLVAEDNENNQLIARELLTAKGARVEIAVDGLDTLTHLVADGRFDGILMDWQMPNMDGIEATREIRQIAGFGQIPIIALTANVSNVDRAQCLAAGMNAHVGKPIDVRELVSVLLTHIRPAAAPALVVKRPAVKPAVKAAAPTRAAVHDKEAVLAMLDNDADLYRRLVDLFKSDGPATLEGLREAYRAGRSKDAARMAHTLKGSAGSMGAFYLAQVAQQTESVFAQAPGAEGERALKALGDAMDEALKALG